MHEEAQPLSEPGPKEHQVNVSQVGNTFSEWEQVAAQNAVASSSFDDEGDQAAKSLPVSLPDGSTFSTYA
jgi:hypothetical protein